MLASPNKSRPQYGRLEPDPFASLNLVLGEGAGIEPIARMLKAANQVFRSRTVLLFVGPADLSDDVGKTVSSVQTLPTIDTVLIRLDGLLRTAMMGTRLYASGTEGFIGRVIQTAERHLIDHKSVVTEHSGSFVRRIHCIHCKGITENVTTNVFACSHCDTPLAVRDHYSRRLGAFMAVSADAEAPGDLPKIEELYR